ncbi:hypothetical protein G6O69_20405 [Pseudenhygromyxa sp. WMMC2535]|uniref:anti-phage dCTP deaminase n=1 Tax=Pseudenhygromyxa sp. WMMC2535 TaxID=2712867 RepID=UPI0015953395|nr:hypothetical protein [Pseudenhygromyxa sp. WMMC2535]
MPSRGSREDLLGDEVRAQETDDLVFGVTGYVGSGSSTVGAALVEQLGGLGFADIHRIKLSDLLAEQGGLERSRDGRVAESVSLQDEGDRLRAAYGGNFVAGLAIKQIYERREESTKGTRVFVLDSLKHPQEIELLRAVYGRGFYLIGVLCSREERLRRLRLKFKQEPERDKIRELMERDASSGAGHGQQVRKTLHRADFFVANDAGQDADMLGEPLERFLQAVTGSKVIRPTRDERGMHAAWSASLRSSCMSRQVGAAITNGAGELLATGTNDPPAPGGGLYTESGLDDEEKTSRRCFEWEGELGRPHCRNDRKKREIYAEIFEQLKRSQALTETATPQRVQEVLERTRVRDLIEFSRAIHAEMDALLTLARAGTAVPTCGTLYCTTYPCHSCARHIVASGLSQVVYIEPYDKSLALELHADAIREVTTSGGGDDDPRVVFRLFSGVAPRRFSALFEKRRPLKDEGGFSLPGAQGPAHSDRVLMRSFLQLEEELARTVDSALRKGAGDDGAQGPAEPSGD